MAEVGQREQVFARRNTYHAPEKFDNITTMLHDTVCQAQWFDRGVIDRSDIVQQYATDGWLPGEMWIEAVPKWCHLMHFTRCDADSIVNRGRMLRPQDASWRFKV